MDLYKKIKNRTRAIKRTKLRKIFYQAISRYI